MGTRQGEVNSIAELMEMQMWSGNDFSTDYANSYKAVYYRGYGYKARRGQQYSGANGDADVVGLPGIHIEVKRREKLNIYDAIDQAKRDRKSDELPAVFHRKNHFEWLVTMPLEDWIKIYREWEAGYGLCKDQQENP